MIVGEHIADYCEAAKLDIPTSLVRSFVEREESKIAGLIERTERERRVRAQDGDAGHHDGQGRDLPEREGPREGRRGAEGPPRPEPDHRGSQQGEIVESRACRSASCARDDQARAVRRLRRVQEDGEPRRPLARGLPRTERQGLAEPHARPLEEREGRSPLARVRASRRDEDGAPAGLARIRRRQDHPAPGHREAAQAGRGRSRSPCPTRTGSSCRRRSCRTTCRRSTKTRTNE